MSIVDLDAPAVSPRQLIEAARGLTDRAWAEKVVARLQQERTQASVRSWIFQLGLVAANSLGRAEEFIPLYDQFLTNYDAAAKPDWHAELTDNAPPQDLLWQSGRIRQTHESFAEEFRTTLDALGPPELGPVLDVGCAGGLYSIHLAKLGYQMFGTDHHSGIIEEAKRNAANAGVTEKTSFAVDDACASRIADGSYSRVICISVTPCLPNNHAFESLISHLDRVTRTNGPAGAGRRVILGHNRWGPSRISALREILADTPANAEQTLPRLNLLQVSWWMQPPHSDFIKKHFSTATLVGKTNNKLDGVRIDLLLQ